MLILFFIFGLMPLLVFVVLFLYAAGLIYKGKAIVDLREDDLSGVELSGAKLNGIGLSGADLRGARLCKAILRWADLSNAQFSEADLRGVDLSEANLKLVSGVPILYPRDHKAKQSILASVPTTV